MNRKVEVHYPDDIVVNVYPKPIKHLKNAHARYFLDEALALAVDRDFSGNDLRVLLAIIGNLGYENILNISQQKLGEQLNIDRAAVTRAVRKLTSKGYLQVVDTVGRQNIYQFNPHVAFRSRAKNYKHLCRAWQQETAPNTQKSPIDLDSDLDIDLEDKLDDKVSELSQQFGVPQSKVRQIILSLVNQALENKAQEGSEEDSEIPY